MCYDGQIDAENVRTHIARDMDRHDHGLFCNRSLRNAA